jgi:hypothetical protein
MPSPLVLEPSVSVIGAPIWCAVLPPPKAPACDPLCDLNEDALGAQLARYPGARGTRDLGEIIGAPDIDVVVISTRPNKNYRLCKAALRPRCGEPCLVLVFAFAPVSCVYYPMEILPEWLKYIAAVLPSALVFEGMRSVLFDGVFCYNLLWRALGLNVLYLAFGIVVFMAFFQSARKRGLLHQIGE